MARIPLVSKATIEERDSDAYEAFTLSRGGEPKAGPYSLIAHMPELAQRLEALRT